MKKDSETRLSLSVYLPRSGIRKIIKNCKQIKVKRNPLAISEISTLKKHRYSNKENDRKYGTRSLRLDPSESKDTETIVIGTSTKM